MITVRVVPMGGADRYPPGSWSAVQRIWLNDLSLALVRDVRYLEDGSVELDVEPDPDDEDFRQAMAEVRANLVKGLSIEREEDAA